MKSIKILGREPAVFFVLVAGVLLALVKLVPFSPELVGAVNGVILAGAGFATAAMVSAEKALPALTGLVQAVFAAFLAYGSPLPEHTQTGILALIAAVGAYFVRQNVYAPIDSSHLSGRLNAAFDNGYQAGQDEAVATSISYEEPARPRQTGAHGHTETMPRVGDVYGQDDTR